MGRLAQPVYGHRPHLPEVDLVQIDLEYLVLVVLEFQDQGDHELTDLAPKGALGGEKIILGQLLGDGGAALADAARPDIHPQGAKYPHQVHAVVLVEICILGRQDRVSHMAGNLGQGYEDAALTLRPKELGHGPGRKLNHARRPFAIQALHFAYAVFVEAYPHGQGRPAAAGKRQPAQMNIKALGVNPVHAWRQAALSVAPVPQVSQALDHLVLVVVLAGKEKHGVGIDPGRHAP
jgi:hypothetical protein